MVLVFEICELDIRCENGGLNAERVVIRKK